MRSKTVSKSANGFKTRGSADKKQNAGVADRQRSSNANNSSGDGRRQSNAAGRTGQGSATSGLQGSAGKGRDAGQERQGSGDNGGQPSQGAQQSGQKSQPGKSADKDAYPQGESPLEKFFLAQLKDIYYAEHKITQSLPKMQEAATSEELKDAFEDHLHQTKRHIKRLEKVFQSLNKKAEAEKCEAIEGIAREVESIIEETEEGTHTRDAALIISAQKVEHYEIATYGGLVQLAITMGLHEAADLLDKTLLEEEDTDFLLTEIAENEVNLGADHEGNHYSWEAADTGKQENEEDDSWEHGSHTEQEGEQHQLGETDEEDEDEDHDGDPNQSDKGSPTYAGVH
jgi:ferritin-like metal-binding protein YciE